MRSTISCAGTTCEVDQWFVLPTSMNSMNRSVWPRSLKYSQRGMISPSFTPRWTTQLILIGKPSAAAASIPSSTRATLKPRPFILPAVGPSSASTETLSRSRPAERSAAACLPRNQPLVVSETSGDPHVR